MLAIVGIVGCLFAWFFNSLALLGSFTSESDRRQSAMWLAGVPLVVAFSVAGAGLAKKSWPLAIVGALIGVIGIDAMLSAASS